jgi:hypothetical protein
VGIVVCHTGSAEQAERDLAVLKNHGSPVGDVVQRRPYTQQQSLLDATQPNGRRYYWKSEYLAGLDSETLSAYRHHGETIQSPHSAAIFFAVGGAINELPADHSPMGNRDANWVMNLTAAWDAPEEDDRHIGWSNVNFLTEDDGEDRIRAAYGNSYDRLVEIKSKWDPTNLFSSNKNIAPQS